jgi:hypothetical protein
MADRNPNIPIERARDLQNKQRELYQENHDRGAEKEKMVEERAGQPDQKEPLRPPKGTPSEKRGGDFPD